MKYPIVIMISILNCFILLSNANAVDPRELLKNNYSVFVDLLKKDIQDPKFLAALRTGDKNKDKIEFEFNVAYPVSNLIPTQNEIDIDKSLKWPLAIEKPEVLASYLRATGDEAFLVGGTIVTAGGKYIIDGHHRWSQLYLINPRAKIKAVNMKINQPMDALKFTQMAIASVTGELPVSTVTGQNLLTIKKEDFDAWIKKNITQSAIATFKDAGFDGIEKISDYLWANIKKMREENQPIEGAPNRGLMPQTDRALGWDKALIDGEVDIRQPGAATAR